MAVRAFIPSASVWWQLAKFCHVFGADGSHPPPHPLILWVGPVFGSPVLVDSSSIHLPHDPAVVGGATAAAAERARGDD